MISSTMKEGSGEMQSKLPSVKDITKNLSNEQKIEMLDILCGQLTSSALHSKDKISPTMLESITATSVLAHKLFIK